MFDLSQDRKKNCIKTEKISRKVLVVQKKFVPLHPLNEKRRTSEYRAK